MKNLIPIIIFYTLFYACDTTSKTEKISFEEKEFDQSFIDERDNTDYGIVEIGNQIWFAENLKFKSPKSTCYKSKEKNCNKLGRLYPHDELDFICPTGWRVPNVNDWISLKANFQNDSIYALLDTVNWVNSTEHSNESGLSIQGTGYQMGKNFFIGEGESTSIWLNQINKYDEYFHVHLHAGKGMRFEKAKHNTNEVFHAHPIDNLEYRKFAIRCICEDTKIINQ